MTYIFELTLKKKEIEKIYYKFKTFEARIYIQTLEITLVVRKNMNPEQEDTLVI